MRTFFLKSVLIGSLLWSENGIGQVQFQEIAQQLGIEHMHLSNEFIGGGVAIFDFNNDGLQDIYLTGGDLPDKLLKNVGNFQFQDVSASSGIASIVNEGSVGVTTGDIDNDGYRDVLVTGDRNYSSKLIRNNGNGTFTELVSAINDGDDWKSAASFGDIDQDGFLDVYIGSYVDHVGFILDNNNQIIGFEHKCSPNHLYQNNGDLSFSDVSEQYGVADTGCALAVAFTDFDFDYDPDLILANDFGQWVLPSTVFENQGQTPMLDVGQQVGMDMQIYGMGIAIGDYDRDSDLDYYQTNLGRNVLSNNQQGVFTDVTTAANVENDSVGQLLVTSWGTFFFDADNDGWPDLFVGNGQIDAADIIANVLQDSNKLYLNNGDNTFSDITATANVGSVQRARGAAYGDLNNDGKLDIVVQNVHEYFDSTNVEIYANISVSGNWLGVKLRGVLSNRDAFGSRVRVVVDGVSTVAEVDGGSSHASQNSSIVHFGLGTSTMADSVIVTFPSGIEQYLVDVTANQTVTVVEDVAVGIAGYQTEIEFSIRYASQKALLKSAISGQVKVQFLDVSGKLIYEGTIEVVKGLNPLPELEMLASGTYLLRLDFNGTTQTLRLLNGARF
ncbi:MAG: VCBS repeat-containing protein [Flavobacteriales bacterium]|nr:VCBS repeat-containing protein [Flavobacteriales bacterium]